MLSLKKKKKVETKSRRHGGSVNDLQDRVVMMCVDIPSEGSAGDSRGEEQGFDGSGGGGRRSERSVSPGARGGERSRRDVRRVYLDSPSAEGYYTVCSTLRVKELYGPLSPPSAPMLIDMKKVYQQTNLQNLEQAFNVAETNLGVTRLLDPEGEDP
ncbi:hypothetical protein Z043_104826 [Scleropages formosus]|uniref:Uncharacterized protein n=1 Tax=Scleropages formosus TaxID=113540 RepID=A0A0P7UN07_SCLFO|nr:hypothetical protein Z043_104826 [Scleropages formosus]